MVIQSEYRHWENTVQGPVTENEEMRSALCRGRPQKRRGRNTERMTVCVLSPQHAADGPTLCAADSGYIDLLTRGAQRVNIKHQWRVSQIFQEKRTRRSPLGMAKFLGKEEENLGNRKKNHLLRCGETSQIAGKDPLVPQGGKVCQVLSESAFIHVLASIEERKISTAMHPHEGVRRSGRFLGAYSRISWFLSDSDEVMWGGKKKGGNCW